MHTSLPKSCQRSLALLPAQPEFFSSKYATRRTQNSGENGGNFEITQKEGDPPNHLDELNKAENCVKSALLNLI